MLSAIASIIASFIEKWGWSWWQERKAKEVDNVKNKIVTLSDSDVDHQLRDKWQRPG